MGLDMYLLGDVFVRKVGEPDNYIDGYPQDRVELELGYWRKHRKLHGYIVNTFAKGVDECQKIELGVEDCRRIAEAIRSEDLPHTEGCFFGSPEMDEQDRLDKEGHAQTFEKAAAWKESKDEDWRQSIYYHASW